MKIDQNIEHWKRIIEKCGNKGIERLRSYCCSIYLGRDFGESGDAYIERMGYRDFMEWANETLPPVKVDY